MFLKSLNIPGSGLTAEQYRLNLIAQNIANVETTRTEKGGPYRRKTPLYQEVKNNKTETFSSYLSKAAKSRISYTGNNFKRNVGVRDNGGVKVVKIIEDPTPGRMIYDPEHPDANDDGYVEMPNIEMVQEMINMMGASRSYEANVQVVNAMKSMAARALEIGR